MKKLAIYGLTLIIPAIIYSCSEQNKSKNNDLDSADSLSKDHVSTELSEKIDVNWLEGSWYIPQGENTLFEIWSVLGDTLKGYTYLRVPGRKQHSVNETMTLAMMEGRMCLTALVYGTEQIDTTVFCSTVCKPGFLRLENPEHDDPQYIEYSQTNDSTLEVEIGNLDDTRIQSWTYQLER